MELMHGLAAGTGTKMLPVQVDAEGRLVVVIDGSAGGAASGSGVIASDGTTLQLPSLPTNFSYNADGQVAHIDVVQDGVTYRQAMTWDSGRLISVSAWEPQP